jgi:hypothetical protein
VSEAGEAVELLRGVLALVDEGELVGPPGMVWHLRGTVNALEDLGAGDEGRARLTARLPARGNVVRAQAPARQARRRPRPEASQVSEAVGRGTEIRT